MANDQRDEFWNIEKLAPNAKKSHPPFKTERATTLYEIAGDAKAEDNRITVLGKGSVAEESTYVPL